MTKRDYSKFANNIPVPIGKVAHTLLHMGYDIVDIAPNKIKHNETIFYFERTEEAEELVNELMKDYR